MPIRKHYFGHYFNTLEVKDWLKSLLPSDQALASVDGQDVAIDKQEDAKLEDQ